MTRLCLAVLAGFTLGAQTPQFEVATIKPTVDTDAPGLITHLPGERGYRGANMPLRTYFMVAYQLRADQISGPDWIASSNFDMQGKTDHTCTGDELHQMLQRFLEEQFHVQMHRETKQVNGYNLVVDTGGPKVKEHDATDYGMMPIPHGMGQKGAKNISMQYLAFFLSEEVGEKVVDKTGLTGHYDFDLQWGYNGPMMMAPGPPPSNGGPEVPNPQAPGVTIFEALRKQIGLRLDKAKVPSEQIVIDHIEKLAEK